MEQTTKITNVNEGVCARRQQEGSPAFFVNWQQDGENQYKFFAIRSSCFTWYERLKRQEELCLKN